MLDFVLDLIYPRICGFCYKLNKEYICDECEKNLECILEYSVKDIKDKYFDKHINIAKYEDRFRSAILAYKFYGDSYLYKTFSKLIIKNKKICKIIRKL